MATPHASAPRLSVSPELMEAWQREYEQNILPAGAPAAGDSEVSRCAALLRAIRTRRAQVEESGLVITVTGQQAWVGRPSLGRDDLRRAAGRGTASAAEAGALAARRIAQRGGSRLFFLGIFLFVCVLLGIGVAVLAPPATGKHAAAAAAALTPAAAAQFVDVGAGNRQVDLDVPASVELRGQAYQVVQGTVSLSTRTRSELSYPGAVNPQMMVYFPSAANWLLGADERVVRAAQIGDEIVVHTRAQALHRFVVDRVLDVAAQDTQLLAQTEGALTLFPLETRAAADAAGVTVRVVRARWVDTSGGAAAGAAADGELGAPLAVGPATVVVRAVRVEREATGLYSVVVSIETTGALPALLLDVAGDQYASLRPVVAGAVDVTFSVVDLGTAQLLVLDKRVALGDLAAPVVQAELLAAQELRASAVLSVTLRLSLDAGEAWLRVGDVVFVDASGNTLVPAQIWAALPAGTTPAPCALDQVHSVVGAPVLLVLQTGIPRGAGTLRVQAFGQAWDVDIAEAAP